MNNSFDLTTTQWQVTWLLNEAIVGMVDVVKLHDMKQYDTLLARPDAVSERDCIIAAEQVSLDSGITVVYVPSQMIFCRLPVFKPFRTVTINQPRNA